MSDHLLAKPIRSLDHSELHAVLTSLTLADSDLSYLAAYEMLDRSVTDMGPNVSTWEAIVLQAGTLRRFSSTSTRVAT